MFTRLFFIALTSLKLLIHAVCVLQYEPVGLKTKFEHSWTEQARSECDVIQNPMLNTNATQILRKIARWCSTAYEKHV